MNSAASNQKPIPLRVEDSWLLAAVREVLLGRKAVEPPVAQGLDWAYLKRQASLHAVEPSLARYCEERATEVPVAVMEQLRHEQADLRAYNFFLWQELGRLTGTLTAKGVDVLAWKGPALGMAAYGDLSLRQSADLDLLVRAAQMSASVSELSSLGYRENVDEDANTRNLERSSPKVMVDLHQMVVQPHFSLAMEADELLEGAVMVEAMGIGIPVPAPEKLLLLLCVHGSKHVWERLAWICDVALFIRANPNLNWERLREIARACRAVRMLNVGLLLAEGLATGSVPPEQRELAQADSNAARLAKLAWGWLFVPESSHALSLGRARFQIAMREDGRDRWPLLKHLIRQGLTPGKADRECIKLPAWLNFGYYLVRPLRLTGKVLRGVGHSRS
jgi:hypothetical protein